MPDKDALVVPGVVTLTSRGVFHVQLTNGFQVICQLSGKMRKNRIHVMPEDKVDVELSPYDLTRGRIVYRRK